MEFRAYKEGKRHCYLSVVPGSVHSPSEETLPPGGGQSARDRLNEYLNLATGLAKGKALWLIVRETPETAEYLKQSWAERIRWKYDLIANDTEGLGVDRGFVPVEAPYSPLHHDQGQTNLLFQVSDPSLLLNLSEDALGDVDLHVTVLGLQQETRAVVEKLKEPHVPQLPKLLEPEDLFMHIVVGKEQGYYDAILIKAQRNMEEALNRLSS
ncbi:MAG: hypothetical protein LPK14_08100 [Hymenobacteraceae bacterium]|nr:hypothetical protein [Hymenobacteraceae bacterium]